MTSMYFKFMYRWHLQSNAIIVSRRVVYVVLCECNGQTELWLWDAIRLIWNIDFVSSYRWDLTKFCISRKTCGNDNARLKTCIFRNYTAAWAQLTHYFRSGHLCNKHVKDSYGANITVYIINIPHGSCLFVSLCSVSCFVIFIDLYFQNKSCNHFVLWYTQTKQSISTVKPLI